MSSGYTRFCSTWKPVAGVGTLDAMTERAGIKKPEGRACASPPLTFSAAATAAGTKILLARRDAGSGFGTPPTTLERRMRRTTTRRLQEKG